MDKTNHTLYIWKQDRRTKTGERLVSTTVWRDRTALSVLAEVEGMWPKDQFRVELVPTMKTVKSLMTGKDVEIPHDTPWSCNPASETYWSM